jgi:hypothetical protein
MFRKCWGNSPPNNCFDFFRLNFVFSENLIQSFFYNLLCDLDFISYSRSQVSVSFRMPRSKTTFLPGEFSTRNAYEGQSNVSYPSIGGAMNTNMGMCNVRSGIYDENPSNCSRSDSKFWFQCHCGLRRRSTSEELQ